MLSNERITAIQALTARLAASLPRGVITGEHTGIGYRIVPDTTAHEAAAALAELMAERAALLARLAELEQKRLYTDWG